jgi:hypothetical protein
MKTSTSSEGLRFVEAKTSVWDRILGLGRWIDKKEAELDQKSFKEQAIIVTPIALLAVYFGLGLLRCGAVIILGAKAIPDMAIDWWWVALLKMVS